MTYKFGIRVNKDTPTTLGPTIEAYIRDDSEPMDDFIGYKRRYVPNHRADFEWNVQCAYTDLAVMCLKLEKRGIAPKDIKVYTTPQTKKVRLHANNSIDYTFQSFLEQYREEERIFACDVLKLFITQTISTIEKDTWDYYKQSFFKEWIHSLTQGSITWQLSSIKHDYDTLRYYVHHDATLVDVGTHRHQTKEWTAIEQEFGITQNNFDTQLQINNDLGFATDTLSVLRMCYAQTKKPKPDIAEIDNSLFNDD